MGKWKWRLDLVMEKERRNKQIIFGGDSLDFYISE